MITIDAMKANALKANAQLQINLRMASGFNGILWETVLTGKLEGIKSTSTSPDNKYCEMRARCADCICHECYSKQSMNYKKSFLAHLRQNKELLTSRILTDDELPTITDYFYRLESHGDTANETQAINYVNICRKNPGTRFALWSKNPWIYKKVFAEYGKPENMIFVLSSCFYNIVANAKLYPFVDVVFTVYTADYAIANNVEINCGTAKCIHCLKCYTANENDGIIYISEILKQESKRYYKSVGIAFDGKRK